jgi:FkbM family methyltransferase
MNTFKQKLRFLRRRLYELIGNDKYSKPSLNNLDNKLVKYLNFEKGFFIEVGANDGYSQSNTYYLEKFLGWKGVLVEAVPEIYEKCKKERKKSYVYNCALVSQDYTDFSVEMHFANLMSVAQGSRKTSEEQAKHIAEGLEVQGLDDSYTVSVPAKTLESILEKLPYPIEIDFFSLDVEGYELNVLRGLNLEKYSPKYILVEATFFDEVNSFLEERYELVEKMSYHDYLYKLKVNA